MIRDAIFDMAPDIAYFPTFVFDFPKKIFLTEGRGDRVSNFYRSVFQDILDYDGKGHEIGKSIIERLRKKKYKTDWVNFLMSWAEGDEKVDWT